MLKIVIPGGSGQVGSILTRAFRSDGHEVTVLSRHAHASRQTVVWDGKSMGPWCDHIDGADVVINLAGRSVDCRYNKANREQIMNSRIDSVRIVGQAICQAAKPPRVWLQASTATIYSHRFDAPNVEDRGLIGGCEPDAPSSWKFSIDVANAWERTLDEATVPTTRKVKLRSAMTMSADKGGIFDVLLRLVRYGLGGRSGSGRQYISWLHHEDFARAIYWLIEHETVEGAVNIASPNPIPNAEFMRAIREAWGTRIGLPATEWMLGIGTFFLRTESELILKSRRVVPGLLAEQGFEFRHATWPEAARTLCRDWRALRGRRKAIEVQPCNQP